MAEYGILGGDDDELEDDNDEGSRGIPSRTYTGSISAFGEKHGWALKPLVLFGGLVNVPFWGYRNMSNAMIEIMSIDVPKVEYKKKGKASKKDISEWEVEMEKIKSSSEPQKIDLNKYIVE